MEAMIMFLYKSKEFDACTELIKVYNKYTIQKSLIDEQFKDERTGLLKI